MQSSRNGITAALVAGVLAFGCSDSDRLEYDYNFAQSTHGFVADFADYPPANASIYMLDADYRTLPAPLDTSRNALYIAGTNRSDDLFMYYKAPGGARPNSSYRVSFDIEFATSAPSDCFGVGGAPGESVYVKAGVTTIEPTAVLDGSGHLRMNVDKGDQSNGGENALVLGDVANLRSCEEPLQWELKSLSGGSLRVTSGDSGQVWLFFGSDSGFESRTALYFTRLLVHFEPD